MADNGDWELVVKSNKKGKNTTILNGKLSKDEERAFIQRAPKAVFVEPIETTQTIPVGKENRKPKSSKVVAEPKKKEKKANNNSTQPPRTIDEAIGRLSVGEMQNLLDVVMSRFLDCPLIWLKDLASFLNVRINPVRHPDPTFKGQGSSYPASRLSLKVKKLLLSTLSQCNDSVLAAFHKHCITNMVEDQIKGLSVAGYKLFIQILSIHRPHICIINLQSYCELRQSIQNQTPSCLSLLWAIGQAGINNFDIGLKVWMDFMVPLIGLKNYSSYVVEYGSEVFSGGGGGGEQDFSHVLGVREFFSIMDFTWCSSSSLPKPIQRQLFALFPKVKTTAFTANPELVLRNFFPSFFRRLNADTPEPLKTELRTCLVQCLAQDVQCWSIWAQLYPKHLSQSAVLLKLLGNEVGILNRTKTEIQNTLKGFAEVNKQMAQKIDVTPGLEDTTDATNALLSRLQKVKRKSKSSSSRFWSILFLVLTAAVLWDIKSAGSFYGSKVGLAIERTGLMPYAEAFGRGVRTGAIQAYRWCIHNIPFYYSKGCDLAEPYLLLVWSRVEWIFTNCWTGIQSAVNYIPVLKENIETSFPGLSASLSYYGNAALEGGQKAFVVVKDVSAPYLLQVHNFVSTKILVGALAPEKLHDYLFGSLDYITHLFYRIHSALLDVTATEVENITAKSSL